MGVGESSAAKPIAQEDFEMTATRSSRRLNRKLSLVSLALTSIFLVVLAGGQPAGAAKKISNAPVISNAPETPPLPIQPKHRLHAPAPPSPAQHKAGIATTVPNPVTPPAQSTQPTAASAAATLAQ